MFTLGEIFLSSFNSSGKWQDEVQKTLGVFFDFRAIKYNHYRWCFGTFLWGYDPALYRRFLRRCFEIQRDFADARYDDMEKDYKLLRRNSWGQIHSRRAKLMACTF
jgi:hypothetical protein